MFFFWTTDVSYLNPADIFYIACRMCWIDLRAGKETWVDVWHTREHLYNHHYLDEWAQRHILSKLRLLNYLVCMGDLLIVRWREQLKLQKFCLWIFFPWSIFIKIQSLLIFSIFIHTMCLSSECLVLQAATTQRTYFKDKS